MEIDRDALLAKYRPKEPKGGDPRCDWQEQLDKFKARLDFKHNPKFPKYTHARIAKLLSGIGIHNAADAHAFYKELYEEAENFGKLFTYYTVIKPKSERA
jgi:hypothetical protein